MSTFSKEVPAASRRDLIPELGTTPSTMLVRFTTLVTDPDSGHTGGVLVAAHDLRDDGDLTADEHSDLRTTLAWFNEYLFVPAMLEAKEHRRAISWFKPSASEAIRRMWNV